LTPHLHAYDLGFTSSCVQLPCLFLLTLVIRHYNMHPTNTATMKQFIDPSLKHASHQHCNNETVY